MVRALLFVLVAQVGTGIASAQSAEMVTDRPDQTESATVVPRGLVQVETGYLFARDGGMDGYAVPGTLARIGLGGRTELRIGHAGIVGGSGRRGAGDSELGAKINLIERADGWRPALALLGGLSLPTRRPRVLKRRRRPVVPLCVRPRVPARTVAWLQRRGYVGVVRRSAGS